MVGIFGRDEVCRQDVGRMAQLGRFGEEFTFYISVYWQEGKIKYRVSEQPDESYDYRQRQLLEGLCPTFIEIYSQRFMIPAGMREGIRQSARMAFAKQMREKYPKRFFQMLEHYHGFAPNNEAYDLLGDLRLSWNGAFDSDHLRLYENLVDEAYLSKLLTQQSYSQLRRWINAMWDQPGLFDEPKKREMRTFSAYLYQAADGQMMLESGLPRYKVMARREQHQQAGCLTTPVFSKTCWLEDITMINTSRQKFEVQALAYLSGDYLEYVRQLRKLPSVLKDSDFWDSIQALEQAAGSAAANTLRWYGRLWNG